MEKTFKALSDNSRREMLDIIKNKPGITVIELTGYFSFSRYGVMKHLKMLEEAELFTYVREGKYKKMYINVMPIQTIYDRWISKYSALWANNLSQLKYKLETGVDMSKSDKKQVYVTYIKTTREKLWEALTNGELTKQYFYGTELTGEITPGGKIDYVGVDKEGNQKVEVTGNVTEVVEYEKFVHEFDFPGSDESPSRVTYEIEETDGLVKLTLTHDQFDIDSKAFEETQGGWPYILSGLKTYLETANPLK